MNRIVSVYCLKIYWCFPIYIIIAPTAYRIHESVYVYFIYVQYLDNEAFTKPCIYDIFALTFFKQTSPILSYSTKYIEALRLRGELGDHGDLEFLVDFKTSPTQQQCRKKSSILSVAVQNRFSVTHSVLFVLISTFTPFVVSQDFRDCIKNSRR